MESVAEIQRTRPQPSVTYTHEVPTMETLMQAWPPQMEAALNEVVLPTAMLDLELVDFCKTLCALLDIPVHDNKLVESMHVLFTLFSEFKANQHFAAYGGEEAIEAQAAAAGGAFAPKNELMRTGVPGFGAENTGADASAAMSFGEPLGNAFG